MKFERDRSIRAHTFSIVARDPATGQMGVAVQSHWFSVGSAVPWGKAGVGVVATQALTEISYGPLGLALMQGGKTAPAALKALLEADDQPEIRQVAMIDSAGNVAAHTGSRCIAAAGHMIGEGFSVQANMMLNPNVPAAMAEAYCQSLQNPALDLAERLICALEAAQREGGDIRGMQSAAILIVEAEGKKEPWEGELINLRVEDHPQPLVELRRLIGIQRAYTCMNRGDALLAAGDAAAAFTAYHQAEEMAPEMLELPFWSAVTLADIGQVEQALPIFQRVFRSDAHWAELVRRLPATGMLKDDPEMLKQILATAEEMTD